MAKASQLKLAVHPQAADITRGNLLPCMALSAQAMMPEVICGAAALPLKEDLEEAGPVYSALCGLATNAETAPKVANLMPQLVQVGLSRLVDSSFVSCSWPGQGAVSAVASQAKAYVH